MPEIFVAMNRNFFNYILSYAIVVGTPLVYKGKGVEFSIFFRGSKCPHKKGDIGKIVGSCSKKPEYQRYH